MVGDKSLGMRDKVNKAKWFIQRGKRGFADCDLWDFDIYLARLITDALKNFKKINQGIPSDIYKKYESRVDLTQSQKDKRATKEWNRILDFMIEGFSLVPELFSEKVLRQKELREEYMYKLEKAFYFLKRYYFNLWD